MPTISEVRKELLSSAVDSMQAEHCSQAETWRAIDNKAQATGALSGIFLAVGFAWAKEMPLTVLAWQRGILASAVVLLVTSVALAIVGLQIRGIHLSPEGTGLTGLLSDVLGVLSLPESNVRTEAYYRDQLRLWERTNQEIRAKNRRKAWWVRLSQTSLMVAILLVTTVTIAQIIK